jgi:hypothetical protein
MAEQTEHDRLAASSPSRPRRPATQGAGGSGSRRGVRCGARRSRRWSECRKSLQAPGSGALRRLTRGGECVQEEGEYEWASYNHDAESGKEEAHVVPAILVQPLGEAGANEVSSESRTDFGSVVPLCKSDAGGPCADEAGGVGGHCHHECKGHPKGYYVHNEGDVCSGLSTLAYFGGPYVKIPEYVAAAMFLGCG